MNAPSDSDRPVNPYRLGTSIVVGTVLGSFALCLAGTLAGRAREGAEAAPAASASTPAGQDLGANAFPLGSFRLVERSGATVDDSTLSGRVCVVSFIFTHCPLSCPKITSVMKSLQPRLEGTGALLVSISVDPGAATRPRS
ncbi:MAG: SCO family protein [Isosphaeraceae bacterium]